MNKNKKNIIGLVIVLAVVLILSASYIVLQKEDSIKLTQLSSQINQRMMGYIIKTKNDKVIVIDGGMSEDAENLKKYIYEYGGTIDYWIITHPHTDHAGAFEKIIEEDDGGLNIKNIYYTANELNWYKTYASDRIAEVERFFNCLTKKQEISKLANVDDELKIDNIKIKVLGSCNPEITNNPINNTSMVFKMYINDKSILFLGDIGEETSKKIIENQQDNLKSDIVQMSHHGQAGATEELYQKVSPQICLWPTPEWLWNNDAGNGYNTGNWKTLETRSWMEKLGVTQNYIAKDGDITITVK